ncbi:hypothetical protein ACLK19_21200 [Escherichia coli]
MALILQREIKDSRLGHDDHRSGVEMSRDSCACNTICDVPQRQRLDAVKAGIKALQEASGFIRSLLGKAMRL